MTSARITRGAIIKALDDLLETLKRLRGPDGCPWDRKQSLRDLCRYLLDESYELQDAIDDADPPHVVEELGDVVFIAFMIALALQEESLGDLETVATQARSKLIRRHPHVFADRQAKDAAEGLRHWQEIKDQEARERGDKPERFLEKIPRSLPAIRRALAVQQRVRTVGFEWQTREQVFAKLLEEGRELKEVMPLADPDRLQDELGDLLFSAVNLARFLDVDPERALRSTIEKFTHRFHYVEECLQQRQQSLAEASLEEMDALWEEAKRRPGPPKADPS